MADKGNVWKSNSAWSFRLQDNAVMFYIENTSTKKVLSSKKDDTVIEENIVKGKPEQMWIKGELDNEEYYTLKNYKWSKVLTTKTWYNQEFVYSIKGTPLVFTHYIID